MRGTLVVAHGRDAAELTQFARRTAHFERLAGAAIAALEPDLAGRFERGLYFAEEAHLDARATLAALARGSRVWAYASASGSKLRRTCSPGAR